MLKTYYMLTKPGIIMGNVITTAAGFILASKGHIDYVLFLKTLLGLSFVIASAGLFNNYLDRAMDAKMERTKHRAFVTGQVSIPYALGLATVLFLLGSLILALSANLLTVFVAAMGFFIYLVLYAFWKYRSFYGTLVGSLAGAIPPIVGYCAVSNRLDMAAFLLFIILVLWQMPHFFAIAIYRLNDYLAAAIPVLPVAKGVQVTRKHMLLYILAFTLATLMLTVMGYTGYLYVTVATLLGVSWFGLCFNGFDQDHPTSWARQMFLYSLVVMMGICLSISIDTL